MGTKVIFESGEGGRVLFAEKHVLTVMKSLSVQELVADASKNTRFRTLVGKGVSHNSIMCMTPAHQQMLFRWLEEKKENELKKIKKNDAPYNISGIPVFGCIVFKDTARVKGSLTLGITRKTGTVVQISHFHRHDWSGSSKLPSEMILKV